MAGDNSYVAVRVEGQSDPRQDSTAGDMIVSPGYFRTMRIPLIAGREFSIQDHARSQGVAIVNESFARRYWLADALPLGGACRSAVRNRHGSP